MMVDFGLPLGATADQLELTHNSIDLAKVAVGTGALYEKQLLARKLGLYRNHDVTSFPGGQFLEYAIAKDLVEEYLRDVAAAGFAAVEVSDNLLDLTSREKHDIISHAVTDHKMKVLGEVGSKSDATIARELIDDALGCLEAGAWKVLFEAAEFFDAGEFREGLANEILREVPVRDVIFELPGTWIEGIGESVIHEMQVWLLERVGPEVNVGNLDPKDVMSFEALRRNLGVKMRFD